MFGIRGAQWWEFARCVEVGIGSFFPDPDDPQPEEIKWAKQVCQSCDVIKECLQWALETDSVGIWGGTTGKQRKKMKKGLASSTVAATVASRTTDRDGSEMIG